MGTSIMQANGQISDIILYAKKSLFYQVNEKQAKESFRNSNASFELTIDYDGNEVSAENNFWGNATGLTPADVNAIDGSVDANPFLNIDPNQ